MLSSGAGDDAGTDHGDMRGSSGTCGCKAYADATTAEALAVAAAPCTQRRAFVSESVEGSVFRNLLAACQLLESYESI